MAEVIKSVIGKLSGTLGNMVFRNIGDKVVIYMRPHNQQISYSEDSVKNRGKFGLTSLLAKYARLLPGIKESWDSTNAEGRSAYTKLIKANSKSTEAERLTINNNITPMGNSLNVKSYSLTAQKFVIEYKIEDKGIDKIIPPYNANLLIFLYDVKNPADERKNCFAKAISVVNEEGISEYNNLEMGLNQAYSILISSYKKAIIFFAITKVENKEVQWTTNFKAEVDI
jgi:hypothetical protein